MYILCWENGVKVGNCFLGEMAEKASYQGVQVCREAYSLKAYSLIAIEMHETHLCWEISRPGLERLMSTASVQFDLLVILTARWVAYLYIDVSFCDNRIISQHHSILVLREVVWGSVVTFSSEYTVFCARGSVLL